MTIHTGLPIVGRGNSTQGTYIRHTQKVVSLYSCKLQVYPNAVSLEAGSWTQNIHYPSSLYTMPPSQPLRRTHNPSVSASTFPIICPVQLTACPRSQNPIGKRIPQNAMSEVRLSSMPSSKPRSNIRLSTLRFVAQVRRLIIAFLRVALIGKSMSGLVRVRRCRTASVRTQHPMFAFFLLARRTVVGMTGDGMLEGQ